MIVEQLKDGKTKVASVFDASETETINETERVGLMRYQNKIILKRRRRRKFFWLFVAAAVSALLFNEQAAVLYVLSTLAICGLLIVVAFSNLEARDAEMHAAAIREATDDVSSNTRPLSGGGRKAA